MASTLPCSSDNLPPGTPITYKEKRYGKMLFRITTIGEPSPERVQSANDFVVRCLLNRLPELLARADDV